VCASSREAETDVPSLTDSEEETIVLAAEPSRLVAETRSRQPYLKQYGEMAVTPPQPTAEPTKPSIKQPVEKQKEIRFSRVLSKGIAGGSTAPYRFDVLAQLANIPARITLYELLRLSKSTREALQEALANAEVFITQVPKEEDAEDCLHAFQSAPCITFTADDMQVKGKHDRPLYFTGYIGSSKVNCIQVDPGSALSIMPRRVMQHLGIPTHRLSPTQTTIYGFNANGTRPMGKIKLKCQIGSLKSEVTCYVIDADTSYNLLLGRPWIHRNSVVRSTLHQVMKYIDGSGKVQTLIA